MGGCGKRVGCGVVLVTHVPKASIGRNVDSASHAITGSVAWANAPRAVLQIRRGKEEEDKDYTIIDCLKSNHGEMRWKVVMLPEKKKVSYDGKSKSIMAFREVRVESADSAAKEFVRTNQPKGDINPKTIPEKEIRRHLKEFYAVETEPRFTMDDAVKYIHEKTGVTIAPKVMGVHMRKTGSQPSGRGKKSRGWNKPSG